MSPKPEPHSHWLIVAWKIIAILGSVYLFIVGVTGMGEAFKLFGRDFAERVLGMTAHPVTGLFLGILATSLVQSSSTSTSIIVGMVAGGAISLEGAIPMIMGANIGTTITASIVSLGYLNRRFEFERAHGAALLHLTFNVMAVAILLPFELTMGGLTWLAQGGNDLFSGLGGMRLANPLKAATEPAINLLRILLFDHAGLLLAVTVTLVFSMLVAIVKLLRSLVMKRIEGFFDRHLFRTWSRAMVFGLLFTFAVQSSSIPTALAIPLAGAGILRLAQVYPFSLGTNLGTTITAMLAALATANETAIVVAFSHVIFNLLGLLFIWFIPPLRRIPLRFAQYVARYAARNRWIPPTVVAGVYFVIPLVIVLLSL